MSDDEFRPPEDTFFEGQPPSLSADSLPEPMALPAPTGLPEPMAIEQFGYDNENASTFAFSDLPLPASDRSVETERPEQVDQPQDKVPAELEAHNSNKAVLPSESSYVRVVSARRRRRRKIAAIATFGFFLGWLGFGATIYRDIFERKQEKQARAAISANEFSGLKVTADGRNLVLTGTATSAEQAKTAVELLKGVKFVQKVDSSKVRIGATGGAMLPIKAVYSEGKLSLEGTRPSPEALDALLKAAKLGLGDSNVTIQFAEKTGSGGVPDSYAQFGAALGSFARLNVRSANIDVTDIETTISGRIANQVGKAEIVQTLGLSSGRTVIDNLEVEDGSDALNTSVATPNPSQTSTSLSADPTAVPTADPTTGGGSPTTVAVASSPSSLTAEARTALQTELTATLKSNRIEFDTDSAQLSADSIQIIADLADALKPSGVAFEVGGHTDSRGKADRNLALSQRRADAVKEEFIKQGISADKVVAKGYGSQKTVAKDNDSRGNPLNRRIEITLQ
jgi:outer membrane protein OmpA-like peptidoglycan-associated protein